MKTNINLKSHAPALWPGIYGIIILSIFGGFTQASSDIHRDDTTAISPPPGSYRILAENGIIEIPFEIFRGDIRFRCTVNGKSVHMLLDDGFMWDQLLFWGSPDLDSLSLLYDGEAEIASENDAMLQSRTASRITVGFPGVEFTDQTAVVTPYSSGTSRMWQGSVGQISATFFKHLVVTVDFDRMIITLAKPDSFKYNGNGAAVPWKPLGFGPRSIPVTLALDNGQEISMKVLMDLGYNDQLQLVVGHNHNITSPNRKLPASLGFNIHREETRGFIGRLPYIEIGGYRINDVIAGFVPEEYGNHAVYEAMIGLNLLSRFNLIFNYHQQLLFIEPNKSFKIPFEYNMSGIEMKPSFGGYWIIKEIHENSPAETEGLRIGDKIIKINGTVITDYDFFDLRSILRQKGAEVDLLIERDGEKKQVTLILRRII